MSSKQSIEVRNLAFALGGEIPRYWFRDERAITLFWNSMSVFFPPGERFFVHTVKRHLDAIEDPRLREEARAFIGQEGMHTREHVRYNAMLQEQGLPAAALEAQIDAILARVKRRIPIKRQLAITCALEHFTALMADLLLGNEALGTGADPTMMALWRWHAAEESEHKAVAFDVYQAAGGDYFTRCTTMGGVTLAFWGLVWRHQAVMMQRDGILWSLAEWSKLLNFLAFEARLPSLVPQYLAYFKPSFHPWQHDNRRLLERWRTTLAPGGPASEQRA